MKYARYALIALLAVSFGVAATPMEGMSAVKWETAKANYIAQLSHDNPGVKASAAGFIRKYNIVEAVDALKEALKCDNCEAVKFSAALALVSVAGDEGMEFIKKASQTEQNQLVIDFYQIILQSDSHLYSAPMTTTE
jgi:hypothetical protein